MVLNNKIIEEDFDFVFKVCDISFLKNKKVMITGANGFLGSLVTTMLLYANDKLNLNIRVIAITRHDEFNVWFANIMDTDNFLHVKQDITKRFSIDEDIDFIIHTANPTNSKFLKEHPIEAFDSIVDSIKNILDIALNKSAYVINFSSMETYGDFLSNKTIYVNESMQGILDLNNMRNSYPIAKRNAEFICNYYNQKYAVKTCSIRLAQTIGAGVRYEENKVYMMFLKCCKNNEDIRLLSSGKSTSSKIYSADVLTAILTLMKNKSIGIFNVANEKETKSIYNMAKIAVKALQNKTIKIIVENNKEKSSIFLKDIKFKLNTLKLRRLNWKPYFNLSQMFIRLSNSYKK